MGLMEKFFGPRWGVHPDDHKRPAADAPTRILPMPALLHIPLQQHVGSPARPVVVAGQKVRRGQLIAEPGSGRVSA
ncbi:MAG TPA: electron transporter RnfC, partial [Rhodocyclaceae bacterium]|nr:electron transporter RnfC [Rhodocyclaceae bacterium]